MAQQWDGRWQSKRRMGGRGEGSVLARELKVSCKSIYNGVTAIVWVAATREIA